LRRLVRAAGRGFADVSVGEAAFSDRTGVPLSWECAQGHAEAGSSFSALLEFFRGWRHDEISSTESDSLSRPEASDCGGLPSV
jgi:hypothetical protein